MWSRNIRGSPGLFEISSAGLRQRSLRALELRTASSLKTWNIVLIKNRSASLEESFSNFEKKVQPKWRLILPTVLSELWVKSNIDLIICSFKAAITSIGLPMSDSRGFTSWYQDRIQLEAGCNGLPGHRKIDFLEVPTGTSKESTQSLTKNLGCTVIRRISQDLEDSSNLNILPNRSTQYDPKNFAKLSQKALYPFDRDRSKILMKLSSVNAIINSKYLTLIFNLWNGFWYWEITLQPKPATRRACGTPRLYFLI